MRSRFLDTDIFHPEMRSEKNPGWKMLKPRRDGAFRAVSRIEKNIFSFLTFGSVSIVIFKHFLRGKSRWKMAASQSGRGLQGFPRMWKKGLFSFLTFGSVSFFHPDPRVSFHREKITMENGCRAEPARVAGF